jgi:hypothetical protein
VHNGDERQCVHCGSAGGALPGEQRSLDLHSVALHEPIAANPPLEVWVITVDSRDFISRYCARCAVFFSTKEQSMTTTATHNPMKRVYLAGLTLGVTAVAAAAAHGALGVAIGL